MISTAAGGMTGEAAGSAHPARICAIASGSGTSAASPHRGDPAHSLSTRIHMAYPPTAASTSSKNWSRAFSIWSAM